MVIPRLPDRTDRHGDPIAGLLPHLEAVTGTGSDFQRRYAVSSRFATFIRQSEAIGSPMGIAFCQTWDALRLEVGGDGEGVFSVPAWDLPGPSESTLPRDCPDKDVIFMKVQREVTKARENARDEDIRAAYARLSAKDPASGYTVGQAHRHMESART